MGTCWVDRFIDVVAEGRPAGGGRHGGLIGWRKYAIFILRGREGVLSAQPQPVVRGYEHEQEQDVISLGC